MKCDDARRLIAAGEDLGPAAEHAATCPDCAALAAARAHLQAALVARPPVDPGLGFETRVTARALERVRGRGRQRAAWLAAAVAAAGAVALFLALSGPPAPPTPAAGPTLATGAAADAAPVGPAPALPDEEVVLDLLALSDLDSALGSHARWDYIEEPLAGYDIFEGGPQ